MYLLPCIYDTKLGGKIGAIVTKFGNRFVFNGGPQMHSCYALNIHEGKWGDPGG